MINGKKIIAVLALIRKGVFVLRPLEIDDFSIMGRTLQYYTNKPYNYLTFPERHKSITF